MPAAYEGTDIISCLRSKYIIRQSLITYRASDISFQIVNRQAIVKLQPEILICGVIVESQNEICYAIIKR